MNQSFTVTLRQFVQENASIYLFTAVLFAMGVLFGSILVNALSLDQKADLLTYLQTFFQVFAGDGIGESSVALHDAINYHLKFIALVWILGLTVIGLPVILCLVFLKGLVVGFTVGFLVNQLALKGLVFALFSVVPQNLLIVPAIIIASVAGLTFSLLLIKSRFLAKRFIILPHFFSYTFVSVAMVGILVVGSFVEAYVSPLFMKWISPYLIGIIIF